MRVAAQAAPKINGVERAAIRTSMMLELVALFVPSTLERVGISDACLCMHTVYWRGRGAAG